MLVRRRIVRLGLVAVFVATGAATPASASRPSSRLHGDVTWPARAQPAPAFTLHDARGTPVSLAEQRGQVVLLTFLYSHCRQLCPVEGRLLASAERRIGRATKSVLLVVSVDPGGDTPASIHRFIRRAGLVGVRWRWLVGTRAQLARVWRAYRIEVKPGGDIAHSGGLYLIDRRGDERSGYAVPFLPNLVASDVATLARGRG